MQPNQEQPRLSYRGRVFSGLLAKILTVAAGILIAAGAIAVSVVLFTVVLAGALVAGAYVWWKTRRLRKHLREQAAQMDTASPGGTIIEAEYREIRRDETKSP